MNATIPVDAGRPAGTGIGTALRALAPAGRPYRPQLAAAVVLLVVAGACQAAIIFVFGEIADDVLAEGSLAAFGTYAAAWGGLATLGAAASFAGGYLTTWAGERVVLRLRDETFAHVQRASPAELARYGQGDVLARLTSDIDAVEQLAASGIVQAVSGCVCAVFFTAAAFWVRWELALAVCAVCPLFWLASRVLSGRMTRATQQERAGNAALITAVEQALSTLLLARLYNRQADEAAAVHRAGRTWMRAGLRQARVAQAYRPAWEIIETASVLAILGLGAWEISVHRLTLGGLLAFAGFLGFLYPCLQSLGELAVDAASAAAAADRLLRLWPALPGQTLLSVPGHDTAGPAPPACGPCEVRLERVSFRYLGAPCAILDSVSLTVPPGELVAITGPSGSGKSTLAGLLVRLLEPGAGHVTVDGVPVTRFPLDELRRLVTLMPQQVTLLPCSVAGNIAYGRPGAGERQITAAARAAGAHEFISGLPDGYDTVIGAGGYELSGGQARRLALARAFIRESPVLILDEPTAALDPVTARQIAASVRGTAPSRARTTIVITHDLAVAAIADRTLVLRNGRIARGACSLSAL